MSWRDYHTKSEQLASEAELANRVGDRARAVSLYTQAAEAEAHAILQLDFAKRRTLSITVVSAASLWYKAQNYSASEQFAHEWLARAFLEPFAVQQLQELLRSIWDQRIQESVGVKFTSGNVFVSVRGGDILTGGAPMDLILRKADEISAILYRTAELLIREPHRRRGTASSFIQEICRPWLFQTAPGSYRFAVRVQQPNEQLDLFPERRLEIEKVLPTFLRIVTATTENPDYGLNEMVPERDYRLTFLKLVRNLAPTGKSFDELGFQSNTAGAGHQVVLVPATRVAINKALRKYRPVPQGDSVPEEVQLSGILRGLQLDEDWLEISIKSENGRRTVRIFEVGETVDDVVGPLVNNEVVVDALVLPSGRHLLHDIQGVE